jgi:hypothetical protein
MVGPGKVRLDAAWYNEATDHRVGVSKKHTKVQLLGGNFYTKEVIMRKFFFISDLVHVTCVQAEFVFDDNGSSWSYKQDTNFYLEHLKTNLGINLDNVKVYYFKQDAWSVPRGDKYALLRVNDVGFFIDMTDINEEKEYKKTKAYEQYGKLRATIKVSDNRKKVYRLGKEYPSKLLTKKLLLN